MNGDESTERRRGVDIGVELIGGHRIWREYEGAALDDLRKKGVIYLNHLLGQVSGRIARRKLVITEPILLREAGEHSDKWARELCTTRNYHYELTPEGRIQIRTIETTFHTDGTRTHECVREYDPNSDGLRGMGSYSSSVVNSVIIESLEKVLGIK